MPLGKLMQEEPPKDSEVDPNAEELERLRAEKAQWEAQQQKSVEAERDSRISELERAMKDRYQNVRQTAAPPPEQSYVAQQELGLTDEEILANPREAIEKMAQHIAQKELAQERAQMTQILGHQVRRGFDAEMNSLSSEPYYGDIQPMLQEYFEGNPQEAIVAGSVRRKYNELVGENLTYLTKLAAEREASKQVVQERESLKAAQHRVVEPPIRPGTPPDSPKPKEGEFELDSNPARAAEKRRLIESFNAHGVNLDEKEFVEIEEGRALPKKFSADIQMGYGGPNVEY